MTEEFKKGEFGQTLKDNRNKIEDLIRRRYFVRPSFEIYGGVAGLYDYGPPGCAVKREIEALWRKHFILEEDMLEISGPSLTPELVLAASGHVSRFSDFLVRDPSNGTCHRADKVVEKHIEELLEKPETENRDHLEKVFLEAGSYKADELDAIIKELGIKAPVTNETFSYPEPFNLMFATQIGPTGTHQGFLRPETAQGIFVNFKHLYEYNRNRLPMAAAQIGTGYRNEIAPRDGLIRVREFTMAEIEHFVNPNQKQHEKFSLVADIVLPLFSQEHQQNNTPKEHVAIGAAVESGLVDNETLGYFMARTYQFLTTCGVNPEGIRFRQHLPNEMAHYAKDCWDAEILMSHGWIECVGHADRAAFDLNAHAEESKKNLTATEKYETPKTVETLELTPNKQALGKTFKKDGQRIIKRFETYSDDEKNKLIADLQANGSAVVTMEDGTTFEITPDMVNPKTVTKTIHEEKFYPSVIEPSFGIGRIMTGVLEHSFKIREHDAERHYLSFPPLIAPIKCSILPLSNDPRFLEYIT